MCPSQIPHRKRKLQQGLGLPTALFVITVMAFLAVAINRLVESNAQASGEEILLIRSFYAAQSGIQKHMNLTFPPDGTAGACPAGPLVTVFDDVEGLNGCQASVSCAAQSVDDRTFYTVTGTGTCGPVSRTIRVRAR